MFIYDSDTCSYCACLFYCFLSVTPYTLCNAIFTVPLKHLQINAYQLFIIEFPIYSCILRVILFTRGRLPEQYVMIMNVVMYSQTFWLQEIFKNHYLNLDCFHYS